MKHRRYFLALLFIAFLSPVYIKAQSIGIGTTNPDGSAVLDVNSTNKGVLVPRVTTIEMNSIANPANGLLVYNTDSTAFAYLSGSNWVYIKGKADVSNNWSTKGNAGTNPSTNFIGTTDNQDLVFKRNNVRAGLINHSLGSVSFGAASLNPSSSGFGNTVIGHSSMVNNGSGAYNNSLGNQVLVNNTTGSRNSAIGFFALLENTTGNDNVSIGNFSMQNNKAGNGGIAIGNYSMYNVNNTTTPFTNTNIAIGHGAYLGSFTLANNTGLANIVIGSNALNANSSGSRNNALGTESLSKNTSGSGNIAIGYRTLYNNIDASNSIAIGDSSLFSNGIGASIAFDEGQANTAVGSKSFKSNTKGKFGTAVGARALIKNSTGFFNTAVGYEALAENVTGSANAAFGQGTLNKSNSVGNASFGVQSLPFLTTGETNTALGWRAGYFNQTGSRNIFIGPESGFNELGSNKLYIENSNADSTNALIFGNFATDKLRINGRTESIYNVSLNDDPAIYGENDNTDFYGIGVQGKGGWKGIEGIALGNGGGLYYGLSGIAEGINFGTNIGVYGKAANGGSNVAGLFEGKVVIGAAQATSAVLEVSSTTQGFLPPRMTNNQRENITNPVAGLILWCTNCGPYGELQVYNGNQWTNMIGGPIQVALGGNYQGGIIAYILQPGDPGYDPMVVHGIIAAPSDLNMNHAYGCSQFIPGADSDAIGDGDNNTLEILAACPAAPASLQCSNYSNAGYSDWHLPSKNELNKLYLNRLIIGGFDPTDYWSSTEQGDPNAWKQNFSSGGQSSNGKNSMLKVRPVRYF